MFCKRYVAAEVRNRMEKILDHHCRPSLIRKQVCIYLFSGRIYAAFKDKYEQVASSFVQPERFNPQISGQEEAEDWLRFPDQWRMSIWYEIFSRSYLLYTIMRSIIPLDRLLALLMDHPKRHYCYLPGMLVLTPSMGRSMGMQFAVFDNFWIIIQRRTKPIMFHLLSFIYQDRATVEACYDEIRQQNLTIEDDLLTPQQRFLRHTICYRVGSSYRVRTNRTPEALVRLQRLMTLFTVVMISTLIPVAPGVTYMSFKFSLWDVSYLSRYPGCDAKLEQLHLVGALDEHSLTISDFQRVYTIFFDIIENAVSWFEVALGAVMPTTLVALQNYDLLICWRPIERRILRLSKAVRYEMNYRQHLMDISGASETGSSANLTDWHRFLSQGDARSLSLFKLNQSMLDQELVEVQAQIEDYFDQFDQANKFTSIVISLALGSWLCIVLIARLFSRQDIEIPPQLRLVQIFPIFYIATQGFYLVSLSHKVRASYKHLFGLIFLASPSSKSRFLEMVEFNFFHPRYAYRLLNDYPFMAINYLALAGWTFSLIAIIHDLGR